jgi:hypothetical protein
VRRLWKYMEGRKRFALLMVLIGGGNAAAQTGGWLVIQNAINKGIVPHNERHLTITVGIYLIVAAAAGSCRHASSAGSRRSARRS